MNSLRASSQAMKQAGIGIGVEEAETVMNELDDQIREASELTSVLSTPLMDTAAGGGMLGLDEELDRELDEELGLLERAESAPAPAPAPTPAPAPARTSAPARPLPPIPEASAATHTERAPQAVSSMLDW